MDKKDNNNRISEILEAFKNFDGSYKREQVDAALELKEEITPALIEILENALADPETYINDLERFDLTYALMLLGHFRESKAHEVIVDLFSWGNEARKGPRLTTALRLPGSELAISYALEGLAISAGE